MRTLDRDAAKATGYKSRKSAELKLEMAFNAGWICDRTLCFVYQRGTDKRWVPVVIASSYAQVMVGVIASRGIYVTN